MPIPATPKTAVNFFNIWVSWYLQRISASFASTDAHGCFKVKNEYFTVTNLSRLRGCFDRITGFLNSIAGDGDLAEAQKLMAEHHSFKDTFARAREYAELARDNLEIFAPTPHRAALEELVDFCVERSF